MKIKVPTSWADVTLNQYIQLTEVPELGFDELESNLKILSILTGVSDYVFLSFPKGELKKITSLVSFIHETPKYKLPLSIKLNGKRYNVNVLPSTISAGEYIDLSEYTKDKKLINKNLPKILAVILQPINRLGFKSKEDYKNIEGRKIQTVESRERIEKELLDLTMDKVFPISDFFFLLFNNLTKTTLHYLKEQERKVKKEIVRDLQQIGDGF